MPPKPTTPKKSKKQIEDEKKRLEEKKKNVEEAVEKIYQRILEEWLQEVGVPPIAKEIVDENTPVLVDPMGEIGRMDFRHVKELHLGKRGMTEIHINFSRLIMLEELWLNGNKLKKNRIESLDVNNFCNFKFLETLLLHENNLKSLDEVMECIKGMRYLKQLTLFGNPLCDTLPKNEYRARVVLDIPVLQVFDRVEITTIEREELALTYQQNRNTLSREIAFGKTVPSHVLEHKTMRLSTIKPPSFMGATAELACKHANNIKKERAVMNVKKEDEERARMEKTLLESKVKQYLEHEEKEKSSIDTIFESLSHVYRDFEGLLLTGNERGLIINLIKNNHPSFKAGKMTNIKASEMNALLDSLGITKFTEKWFKLIEEKPNSLTEDEKKKLALFRKIVAQNEVSFQDLFYLICEMKSEEEFINSHDLQKQLIDKRADFEKRKKERIEKEQEDLRKTPVQANEKRPKSGAATKNKGQRKPTDNTDEEDKEIQQIEQLSKNVATLELQAASRAIKWQTKSQLHESFRPKELKIVQKRSDFYKSHYL
ncbi:hypothetical protein NAEGRDRAFT_58509 [Naegleria gruberi]|uniref:Uncharacterized protein n=1 Tax=Naegleria gruberi TaxID=5762 RepID=D2VKP4_NAEGR|nr:uncharacterized protein NAEGRDRAFT_58509 [Naegleria gruberi]EFC42726.1 hypothetical protein NAEGRDRAFT_58509 [Naegleria gruberi]|eukprot:XP_002675470.1 hypothetical protein NAEGRDRAFT_58509 [Naegleria gruberi strain NEG-M]